MDYIVYCTRRECRYLSSRPDSGISGWAFRLTQYPLWITSIQSRTRSEARDCNAKRIRASNCERGHEEIRIKAPDATRVEIMGDFTDWNAISLQQEGNGWWS